MKAIKLIAAVMAICTFAGCVCGCSKNSKIAKPPFEVAEGFLRTLQDWVNGS